jgi:hypothetical protein
LASVEKITKDQLRMQSEGAEFLVLGQLLIRHINAAKAYTNFPDWDILAFDAKTNKQVKIQVKSRYASDSIGFMLKSMNLDFLVVAHLNMGIRYTKGARFKPESDIPQFWVIPKSEVEKAVSKVKKMNGVWNLSLNKFPNKALEFENAWHLIKDSLA